MKQPTPLAFSAYHKLLIFLIATIQFTVILDFLIMAPMGDLLRKSMGLTAAQFGFAVSAYALSAGLSGLLVAGFADKYRRKTLLVFAYTGFTIGTLLCGTANGFHFLLAARIVAGLFGGIVMGTGYAIVTDVFPYEQRGRVMGYVQMAFSACQVAGLPLGLLLASQYGWHVPFLAIAGLCLLTLLTIAKAVRPALRISNTETHPLRHLLNNLKNKRHAWGYFTMAFVSLPGYMLFPFSAQFVINNIGLSQERLGFVYLVVGIASLAVLPLVGRLSDKVGKRPVFFTGTALSVVMMAVYVNLPAVSVATVCLVTAIMYAGLLARNISSSTLVTAVPAPENRGAFMSINASLGQIAGGASAAIAGQMIYSRSGYLVHFDAAGYVCMAVMIACCIGVHRVNRQIVKSRVIAELKKRMRA